MDQQQYYGQPGQPKSGKKAALWAVLGVVIGALLGGLIVFLVLNRETPVTDTSTDKRGEVSQQMQTEATTEDKTANWRVYENKEIGIKFKYPAEYGNFVANVYNGDTGRAFYGTFSDDSPKMGERKIFAIGGNSADFTQGRSAEFWDIVEVIHINGKYYHALGSNDTSSEVEPVKVLTVDGQKVLIVNNHSYVDTRDHDEGPKPLSPGAAGGALITLPGSEFKAMSIQNADTGAPSQTELEEILATFTFTK